VFKKYGAAVLALLLAACGAPQPRQQAPPAPTAPEAAPPAKALPPAPAKLPTPVPAKPPPPAPTKPPAAAGKAYRIDPAHSELRLLVYRSGAMASLGHNHVIVNRALSGWVADPGGSAAPSFLLHIPVAEFVMDDAALRREEGADFADAVPEDAKAGTVHNMLSAGLLNAAQFPAVMVRSVAIRGTDTAREATLAVNVAGHESTLVAPFTVASSQGSLTASGTLNLRQSDLGLTPFSVMLGALKVQDGLRVKFKIVAVAD
jgi:polyisoprenoid-binding protein YceI